MLSSITESMVARESCLISILVRDPLSSKIWSYPSILLYSLSGTNELSPPTFDPGIQTLFRCSRQKCLTRTSGLTSSRKLVQNVSNFRTSVTKGSNNQGH